MTKQIKPKKTGGGIYRSVGWGGSQTGGEQDGGMLSLLRGGSQTGGEQDGGMLSLLRGGSQTGGSFEAAVRARHGDAPPDYGIYGGSQTGGKKKLPAALVPHMKIAVKGGELWRKLSPAQQAAWKARDGKGSGYMKWMKAEGRRQAMAALGITQAYLDGLKASKK